MAVTKRFVILSGPSCVGKGPLQAAVDRFYPELLSARPVLCNSRPPRRNELHGTHYYFLPRALISLLKNNPDFVVAPVRSDLQAIDLLQVEELLSSNDLVFAEVYYTFGPELVGRATRSQFAVSSVFLLPLPLSTPSDQVIEFMCQRLKNRAVDESTRIEERSQLAPVEMGQASAYTHRILNLATEDNTDEWGELGTCNGVQGDRKIQSLDDLGPNVRFLVETFVKILRGGLPPGDYEAPPV